MKNSQLPLQVRVMSAGSGPASIASDNSRKQVSVDVRVNIDMETGKIRLSVPSQQPSAVATDNKLKPVAQLKPGTSSTQPARPQNARSVVSVVSQHSNHSASSHLSKFTLPGSIPRAQQTYCVLCKRGYLPHQFQYHLNLHRQGQAQTPQVPAATQLTSNSFMKKQAVHFATNAMNPAQKLGLSQKIQTSSNRESLGSQRSMSQFNRSGNSVRSLNLQNVSANSGKSLGQNSVQSSPSANLVREVHGQQHEVGGVGGLQSQHSRSQQQMSQQSHQVGFQNQQNQVSFHSHQSQQSHQTLQSQQSHKSNQIQQNLQQSHQSQQIQPIQQSFQNQSHLSHQSHQSHHSSQNAPLILNTSGPKMIQNLSNQHISMGSSHRSINQLNSQNFITFQQIPIVNASGSFRVVEPEPQIHLSSQPSHQPSPLQSLVQQHSFHHSTQQQNLSNHLNKISQIQHLGASNASHVSHANQSKPVSRILDSQLLLQQPSIQYGLVRMQQKHPSNRLLTSNISNIQKAEPSQPGSRAHTLQQRTLVDRLSESQDDLMWKSMMVDPNNYKYERIRRPWELEDIKDVKETVVARDNGKQRLPKNLLAVEMAVEKKKQMDASKKADKKMV